MLKNTVLLFLLVLISCGSDSKKEAAKKDEIPHRVQNDKDIVVGANQTENYLSLLNGKRVGIVANQTSVIFKLNNKEIATSIETNASADIYVHLVDSLLSLNVAVKKVFAPEHGFRGKADAGEVVKDGIDTKTGLPIVSLYGKNKKPSPEQLKDLDIVIFDIQDVGARFYTYISSLHYVMEACAEQGIPLLILDRPNPNGHYIDGPILEIEHKSFVGMHPIPTVHGMTIGEYGKMINGEQWLTNSVQCDITVIPVKNYTHDSSYSLPIRPSPNLPNDQSIKLYPSLGLFEGTTINAGRGTEFQFQRYGAPYLNKDYFNFEYTPKPNFGSKYPKHKEVLCYGEDLSLDKHQNSLTLKWIIKAYTNSTDKASFFNTDNFTIHAGTEKLQKQIEQGLTEKEIKATWQEGLDLFKVTRSKYLIYE